MQDRTRSDARDIVIACDNLHNLGDAALLLQNLEVLTRQRPGARKYVRVWNDLPPPEIARQIADSGAVLVSGRRLMGFARVCRGADMLIGSGQMMRENGSWRELLFQLVGILAVKAGGGQVFTRAIGADAVVSRERRWLWGRILGLCRVVGVRDRLSVGNILDVAPRAAIVRSADMMFTDSALTRRLGTIDPHAAGHVIVAPCVDRTEGRSSHIASFDALRAAIRAELPHATLTFACHDTRDGMDIDAVAGLVALDDPEIRIFRENSVTALIDLYRGSELVITNRLHGIIFAILSDKPVIVIDDGATKLRELVDAFQLVTLTPATRYTADELRIMVRLALAFDREQRADVRRRMARLTGEALEVEERRVASR